MYKLLENAPIAAPIASRSMSHILYHACYKKNKVVEIIFINVNVVNKFILNCSVSHLLNYHYIQTCNPVMSISPYLFFFLFFMLIT